MRIFKKRVAILLAALLVLSAFSMVAFADDSQPVVVATQDEATPDQATGDETTPDESQPATEATEATQPATEATQPATEATQDETQPATEATEPTTVAPVTAPETVAPVANVWTVAGNIPALGGDWDPANTANALTKGEDGIYSISWDNVAAGEYEFKVTNGTWDEAYGLDGENFYVNVTADSDLKITFNAETKEITVSGTNVTTERPAVQVVAGYYVTGSAGLCGADWANKADPATLMFKGEDGNFYKDFTNVVAGTYNFKVIYVDANGKVTWHPGGMGNDSEVTVEKDGSLVRVSFTPVAAPDVEGADGQEAAVGTVYADPTQAPEIKPYVEPTTEPTTATEATQPATSATQPTTSATQPTTAAPAAKVALNKTSVSLKAGKTATIKVTGTTAKATFKSSKTSVAKVTKNGKVTGLKKGTATITVKVAGKTLKCKVKVTTSPKIKIGKKKFSAKKTYTVKKGKTLKVKVTGKAKAIKNKFKVNKKKGLKVSGATTVKIKAKKKGTYKVTLTVNKSKKFVIKVDRKSFV
jgi:hypothetical protein